MISGEGVLGLPRQFLLSGSRSVIMSNWKVDDEFTATFMPRFYQYFLQNGNSKVTALTKAKHDILIDIKKDAEYHYQHPFFWAAFNLYGDAGTENEAQILNRPGLNYLFILILGFVVVGSAAVVLFFLKKRRT